MNKQQWSNIGARDAELGNEKHKPAAGWQLVAYKAGWESVIDERAVKKETVNQMARERGIVRERPASASKHFKRWTKRMDGLVKRIEHNLKMALLTIPAPRVRHDRSLRGSLGLD